MMIEAPRLLKDLKRHLKILEEDIRARLAGDADLQATLRQEWQAAQSAGRTGRTEADWLDEEVTQAAAHWILGCVFLRFIEDNRLVERPWLAGRDDRLTLARDRHGAYFRAHPHESGREYLMACFREAEALPGVGALFDEALNPLWRLPVSGDGADTLVGLFQRVDPDRGSIDHDFTDPDHGTRFLGDLYQDLSEAAKKRYALLQTPEFVERFILDRTLTPAIDAFGWPEVRLIDPACGSGHFLLDAFARLFDLRVRHDMNSAMPSIAQAALDQVAGVDINPFAVAIARFRLLVAALKACGVAKLKNAPDFKIHVATGDSLLHGRRFDRLDLSGAALHTKGEGVRHFTHSEDAGAVDRILGRQYHVVVGNPPYITPKDPALREAYRERYAACHGNYQLAVPFIERFFDLALADDGEGAGFIGMINAKAFITREFGKKVVEEFLPGIDLTHIIDMAGIQLRDYGVPTIILFGRSRRPVASHIRTVMSLEGEKVRPEDPTNAPAWVALISQVDLSGSESEFFTVADTLRTSFSRHPWSIGGGGASELRALLDQVRESILDVVVADIGFGAVTREDAAYLIGKRTAQRHRIPDSLIRIIVEGEDVRDHNINDYHFGLWPYYEDTLAAFPERSCLKFLWIFKEILEKRVAYGSTQLERGLKWFEYSMFFVNRFREPLSITFAKDATHNHFVLDRGGKVFKQTAPVIKLPTGSTEDDHLALLGLLNSSTACFWMKQVCHDKGTGGVGGGLATERWDRFYALNSTRVSQVPLVEPYPTDLAQTLDGLGQSLSETLPKAVFGRGIPTRADLDHARQQALSIRRRMNAWQEELDWRCYRLYGLLDEPLEHAGPPEIALGERAFEIVMARQIAAGELETTWFERHSSTPIMQIPARWPAEYRTLVEERIARIEADKWINLIERPEYKRRWQWRPWEEQEKEALRDWLLDRLEDHRYWGAPPVIRSINQIADSARADADFMAVAELYTGRPDFTVAALVADLIEAEAVPFLPVLRYTRDGLRKRAAWEQTWDLQRREDAGEDVGDIPVPPKYKQKDFQKSGFWRLRGGLDVPKERFVSYPGCARDADGSLPVAWAGYDHRRQAEALWTYYTDRKDREGWQRVRLEPLLAGLADLVPWLKQWHNELDPASGVRFGDYFEDLLADEARALGLTINELNAWAPPPAARNRRGRRRAAPADLPADPSP